MVYSKLYADHSGWSRPSGASKLGASSFSAALSENRSLMSLCCFGPSCWTISGRRSLMVFVSGSPETINVLFWMDAYASGLLKCRTVLSSLKKLT